MPALFLEGALLGLSTGLYCLTACLPLLAPYLMSEGKTLWKENLKILLQFLGGRLAAYLLFAVLASLAGQAGKYALPAWLLPASTAACGLTMVLLACFRISSGASACLLKKDLNPYFKRLPMAMGFITGINVCPPFAAGLLRLLELADIPKGLAYFTGFFCATSLFVSPVMLGTPWLGTRANDIGRLALLLAGLWYTLLGLAGLFWA
ncbi:MAG TPA: sulfite exporter TauE/SafE family protein [Elusimicrobiales bacterium]|nr:sulfite exporter TauE/SafE family protein [Elusimicrobiales bacterium]